MLSDSTPGRDTVEALPKRSPLLMATSRSEQGKVLEEQRLDHQARLQWLAYERALPQQRSIVAEQLDPRHLPPQPPQRFAPVRIEAREPAAAAGRQVGRPGRQPVHDVGEPRLAGVLF